MTNINLDLERKVIGNASLFEPAVIYLLDKIQSEEVFTDPICKASYLAIKKLVEKNSVIDLISIAKELTAANVGEENLMYAELITIQNQASAPSGQPVHCAALIELYTKRRIQEAGLLIQKLEANPGEGLSLITRSMEIIQNIDQDISVEKELSFKEQVQDTVDKVIRVGEGKELSGLETGDLDLDKALGGFQPKTLYIEAGRPSMGKTALMLHHVRHLGLRRGVPVAVFSLEMGYEAIIKRMIAAMGLGLDMVNMKNGVKGPDLEKLEKAKSVIENAPIFIDDKPNQTLTYIIYKSKKLAKMHGIKAIFIDYLQFAKGYETTKYGTNKVAEVSDISNGLKQLARALNVPVILLSQLNRAVETRAGDKRPLLSDLRDSGSIEQDADVIIFPYRAEYYDIEIMPDGSPSENKMELIIAKGRDIGTGSIMKGFDGRTQQVYSLDDQYSPGIPMTKQPF